MKQIIIGCLMLLLAVNATGQMVQVQEIDSLLNVLNTQKLKPEDQMLLYKRVCGFYIGYDLDKGIEYARKGLQLAEKENDKGMISTFYIHLGIYYFNKSSFDTAHIYLEKSLDYAIEAKDKVLEIGALGSLGNLYKLQEDYQTAVEYYTKALAIDEPAATQARASILNNLGVIHRALNNTDRAIDYLNQSLDFSEQHNLNVTIMSASHGLGTIYSEERPDYDKAMEYMSKTLEISRILGNKQYEILSLMSLGTNFSIKGDHEKALEYAHESLSIAEEYGYPILIYGGWSELSRIYSDQGRYKESEEYALKSWAADSTSVELASGTAMSIAIANIYLGNKDKAKHFILKYKEIVAKGNKESLHNSIANMEVRYETQKKNLQIAALEEERQLYIWLGIVGALLAVTLGVVLWQKIKNTQKEKQLIATRSVLDGEMGERSRLARDLHDRLSGNLSAVKIGLSDSKESLQGLQDKLDSCIDEIRRVAHNLMPTSLQYGLKVALEDYAAQFPNVHFHFFGNEKRIDERKEFVVYCCASELVNNSLKHSGAKNINLQLVQDDEHATLTVQDDGSGFNEKAVSKGSGLKNIRDRVASCNGTIDINAPIGKGTETTIEIKL